MSEKIPQNNKYEGLTAEEIEELESLRQFMSVAYEGSQSGEQLIEFYVEQERLWKLLAHALEELQENDPQFYYRLLIAVRSDMQKFWDLVNEDQDTRLDSYGAPRLDANQDITEIEDLRFTGLFTNDGFAMRKQLIENLSDYPKAKKVVDILNEIQALSPDLN